MTKSPPLFRTNGMYRRCRCAEVDDVSTTTGPEIQRFGSVGSGHTVGSSSEVAPGRAVCENASHAEAAKSPGVFAPPSFALLTNTRLQPGSLVAKQPVSLLKFM